jgi:hypothetical protein
MLKVVEKQAEREANEKLLPLDEGARRMLIEALRAEAEDYVERHCGERDEHGRALVVRNGLARDASLPWEQKTVELKAPRIEDRRAVMNKEVASASPADSCHLTCGVHPK